MGSHAVETTRDRLRAIIEEVRPSTYTQPLIIFCLSRSYTHTLLHYIQVEEWKHLNFPSDRLPGENEHENEEGEHSRTDGDDGDGDDGDGDEDAEASGSESGAEDDYDGEEEAEGGRRKL